MGRRPPSGCTATAVCYRPDPRRWTPSCTHWGKPHACLSIGAVQSYTVSWSVMPLMRGAPTKRLLLPRVASGRRRYCPGRTPSPGSPSTKRLAQSMALQRSNPEQVHSTRSASVWAQLSQKLPLESRVQGTCSATFPLKLYQGPHPALVCGEPEKGKSNNGRALSV
jgi:hypothetical protein